MEVIVCNNGGGGGGGDGGVGVGNSYCNKTGSSWDLRY